MPFNQLLLPLIGGYLLINFTHITSHWTSRQSKEQLLLAAAFAGFVALVLARTGVVLLMMTDAGPQLYQALHRAVPYDGIGTALLACLICLLLRQWINKVWSKEDAALWLYGTGAYDSLERLFFFSFLRVDGIQTRPFFRELMLRMFWFPITQQYERIKHFLTRDEIDCPTSDYDNGYDSEVGDDTRTGPVLVMLSMKDRKVYVGWLEWVPPLRADTSPYIKIVPAWSGYRDAQTMRIVTTEQYEDALFQNPDAPRGKILAIGDISNASLYDPDVYASFLSTTPQDDQSVTSP